MAQRGLDTEMIVNLHDVVERNFSKMSTQLEASSVDQVKKGVRKEFCSYLWSWSLLIQKRVVWSVKRLVRERIWHGKAKVEEVGFFYQFVESNTELTK